MLIYLIIIREYVHDMATVPQINLLLFCFETTCYITYFNNMQNYTKKTNNRNTLLLYFYFQAKPSPEMKRNIYKNVSMSY